MSVFKLITITSFLQIFSLLASCDNYINDENTILNSARTAYLTDNNLKADELYKKYLTEFPCGNYRIEAWERIYDISTYLRRTKEDSLLILDSMLLEFKENESLYKKFLLRAIDLNVNLNRIDIAIWHINTLLMNNNITPDEKDSTRLQLSKIFSFGKNNEQALSLAQQCLTNSENIHIYCLCSFYNAHILTIQNNFEQAKDFVIKSLEKCSSDETFFSQGSFILGDIYENLDDKLHALQCYESISSSHPNPLLIKTKIQHLTIK